MGLHKNILDFYKLLSVDETILRLLYYTPENGLDDPLDKNKDNLVESDIHWDIVADRIIHAPKTDDLNADKPICRLCVYPGDRLRSKNKAVHNQAIICDVFSNLKDYESVDLRSAAIVDRLDELIEGQRITGIGKVESSRAGNLYNAPKGYFGYRVEYTFGSVRK